MNFFEVEEVETKGQWNKHQRDGFNFKKKTINADHIVEFHAFIVRPHHEVKAPAGYGYLVKDAKYFLNETNTTTVYLKDAEYSRTDIFENVDRFRERLNGGFTDLKSFYGEG
jgi:hypothetical protein